MTTITLIFEQIDHIVLNPATPGDVKSKLLALAELDHLQPIQQLQTLLLDNPRLHPESIPSHLHKHVFELRKLIARRLLEMDGFDFEKAEKSKSEHKPVQRNGTVNKVA